MVFMRPENTGSDNPEDQGLDTDFSNEEYIIKNTENYSLSLEQAQKETARFLSFVPESSRRRDFGLYNIGTEFRKIANYVESVAFRNAFSNSPRELSELYHNVEHISEHITVIDHREALPAGTLRIIRSLPDQLLPTFTELEELWKIAADEAIANFNINPGSCYDIGTLAVLDGYRGGPGTERNIAAPLYYALHKLSLLRGIENWVGILDKRVMDYLLWIGLDLQNMGAPQPYHGSPESVPFVARVADISPHLKQTRPRFHRILVEGEGLTDFDFPEELKPDQDD